MNRLFPRAIPQALTALLLLGSACNPSSNVQPGAPVLLSLALLDPSGNRVTVAKDTAACDPTLAEGQNCDPGTPVCEMGANVVCQCVAKDMCDPTINPDAAVTGGTLNCTFPPLTKVVATFDRLLNTAPFEAVTMAPVATLTSDSTTTVPLTAAGDYTSSGSTIGIVFPQAFGIDGPTITLTGTPGVPDTSTSTFQLLPSTVQAKDGKTPFTGASELLLDGKIAFKTSGFAASITTPAAPPPPPPPPPTGCPDAGTPMTVVDGGADADAETDSGVSTDAAVASVDAASAAPAAAPTASPDVPSDMNTGAITIAFTNNVGVNTAAMGGSILDHITVTEDGVAFTGIVPPDPTKDLPAASLTLALKPKTTWAPGKTYVVTVDKDAADVFGVTLGSPVSASFTMSPN
jgi:hypothetical protein